MEFLEHPWNSGNIPGILGMSPEFWEHTWNSGNIPGILGMSLEFWEHTWNSRKSSSYLDEDFVSNHSRSYYQRLNER